MARGRPRRIDDPRRFPEILVVLLARTLGFSEVEVAQHLNLAVQRDDYGKARRSVSIRRYYRDGLQIVKAETFRLRREELRLLRTELDKLWEKYTEHVWLTLKIGRGDALNSPAELEFIEELFANEDEWQRIVTELSHSPG